MIPLTGSVAQIEWAERIRLRVDQDFDRVAAAFHLVASRQSGNRRAATEALIAILEEKRAEVMSRPEAGYFIHDWQETGDRVRLLILKDPRYQDLRMQRP